MAAGSDVLSLSLYFDPHYLSQILSVNLSKLVLLDPLMNACVGELILENCPEQSGISEKFRKRSAEFDETFADSQPKSKVLKSRINCASICEETSHSR